MTMPRRPLAVWVQILPTWMSRKVSNKGPCRSAQKEHTWSASSIEPKLLHTCYPISELSCRDQSLQLTLPTSLAICLLFVQSVFCLFKSFTSSLPQKHHIFLSNKKICSRSEGAPQHPAACLASLVLAGSWLMPQHKRQRQPTGGRK